MSNKIYLNKDNIKSLKPALVWEAFYDLNQIPRGSGNQKQVSKFLEEYFKKYSNNVRVDEVLNVTASIPATKGYENYPTIIIQGHMDMVCEKSFDSKHDFLKDPISMYVEDGWVHADGTTLGADNGIGVAIMMAIAADNTICHGPLELIITVDEEVSLKGAIAYNDKNIKGQYMINLDMEWIDLICIGSCGGHRYNIDFDLKREKIDDVKYLSISISGGKSGHSGVQINKKLVNALVLLNDINLEINNNNIKTWIADFNGGSAWNAIAGFGNIVLAIKQNQIENAKAIANDVFKSYCEEYSGYENLKIEVNELETYKYLPINEKISKNITTALLLMLDGIFKYDFNQSQMDACVSCGKLECDEQRLRIYRETRHNFKSQHRGMLNKDQTIVELCNAKFVNYQQYDPWSPKFDNNVMTPLTKKVFKSVISFEPKLFSAPGGLECSMFISKYKNIKDCISIGPNLVDVHTPNEKVEIKSTEDLYKVLIEFLKEANQLQ